MPLGQVEVWVEVWIKVDGFEVEDETIVFEKILFHLFLNHYFCRLALVYFMYLCLAGQHTLPLLLIIINPSDFNEV